MSKHVDIAMSLAQEAKNRSSAFTLRHENYAFAFGYLTGTLASVLMMLTPEQLAEIEIKNGLSKEV
jgi:hypothetical protein